MKKTLIILALIGMILIPSLSQAATVEELQTQTNILIQQLITLLTQEIARLQAQLADMIANQIAQNAVIQQQAQVLGSIQQNTTPIVQTPVIVPEVKKELTAFVDANKENPYQGNYYNIYAFYLENGKKIAGVPMTISADDNGVFAGEGGYFNKVTKITEKMGYQDGQPGIFFQYIPSATGTRVLSFEANGMTTTIQSMGQSEAFSK